MNEKIIIREPLFIVPNENKSNVLKYENNNNFNNERNDAANLGNYINTTLPYKRNEKLNNDTNEIDLDLNEKENMNFFLNKKNVDFKIKNNDNKNIIQSYRKGEINASYNIMDNMYDIYYTKKSSKNLNDYIKHVNVNHTAPCVGEFRTCMNCFLNISTLFCKTCNIFLCAVCNIKLHQNNSDHVINVASSGLYENNIKYDGIILKEKNKWLVELDNSVPIKIKERCPIHSNEYIKYVCKTCKYTLLCIDCLLNDPIHVKHKNEEDDDYDYDDDHDHDYDESEDINKNINNNINTSTNNTKLNSYNKNSNAYNKHSSDRNSSYISNLKKNIKGNNEKENSQKNIQLIVSLDNADNNNVSKNSISNHIENLKPGFKLIRGSHEILTVIDARNAIKEELNDKLEFLCKKSLVLKNTLPSLSNIYKYGRITCKNNKRCIRSCFTVTNNFLEKRKMKLYNHLKTLQNRSTDFLRKLDEERTNYKNYLEKKRNEIQHMIKLSNRNAGLALDYYVEKLESFRNLFFTKDNLIDIEKKLEIPHSVIKSENLPLLIEKLKSEISNTKTNISNASHDIKNQFQYLFNSNIEIPVYPAHFQNFLQKRTFNREIESLNKHKKIQQYFHILPFTDFYMNIKITYQQKFMRKDSLHQKWELRTISIRSIYMCIHTHSNEVDNDKNYDHISIRNSNSNQKEDDNNDNHNESLIRKKNNVTNLNEEEMNQELIKSRDNNQYIKKKIEKEEEEKINESHTFLKNISNNLSNDIESIISLSNVHIKTFNDPNITNITILEKRNYPYGIELTEYNDKDDLVGYWLLTSKNESIINELFNILNNIKKDNANSALIPSFHPKINMNSPFFNYHENNISLIYKHFSANIHEDSYMYQLKKKLELHEKKYADASGKKESSTETSQDININKYEKDTINQNYNLIQAYNYFNDSKSSNSLNELNISKLYEKLKRDNDLNSLHSSTCSKYNEYNKLDELKKNKLEPEFSFMSSKELKDSELKELKPEHYNLTYSFNIPRRNILNKKNNNSTVLRKTERKREENINYDHDIHTDIIKRNLMNEEKHSLPLYPGSNILNNDYLSDYCSNDFYINEIDDETKMKKENFFNNTNKNIQFQSNQNINNIVHIKKENDFTDISTYERNTNEIINNSVVNNKDSKIETKNYEIQNSSNALHKDAEKSSQYSKNNLNNENNYEINIGSNNNDSVNSDSNNNDNINTGSNNNDCNNNDGNNNDSNNNDSNSNDNDILKYFLYKSCKDFDTKNHIICNSLMENNEMDANNNIKNKLFDYINIINKNGKENEDEYIKENSNSNMNSFKNQYYSNNNNDNDKSNNNDTSNTPRKKVNSTIYLEQVKNSNSNREIKIDKINGNNSNNTELDKTTHIDKLVTKSSNSCNIEDLKNIISSKINHLEVLTNKHLVNYNTMINYNIKDLKNEKKDVYNDSYSKNMKTADLFKLDEVQKFLQKLNDSEKDINDMNSKENISQDKILNKKKNNEDNLDSETSNLYNCKNKNNVENSRIHNSTIEEKKNNIIANENYKNTQNLLEKNDYRYDNNDIYKYYDCENRHNMYMQKYKDCVCEETHKKNIDTNREIKNENIQNNSFSLNVNYLDCKDMKSSNFCKADNYIKRDEGIQKENNVCNIMEQNNKVYLEEKNVNNFNCDNNLNSKNSLYNNSNIDGSNNMNNFKKINQNAHKKNDEIGKSYNNIITENNNIDNNKLHNFNYIKEETKLVKEINDENKNSDMNNQNLFLFRSSMKKNWNNSSFKLKNKEESEEIHHSKATSSFNGKKKVSLENNKNNEDPFKSMDKYENKSSEFFHINGKIKMANNIKKIQEKMESKIKKYKLEITDKNKAPPSKKNKNNMKHDKIENIEINYNDSINVINKVLSQIGNKKLGS